MKSLLIKSLLITLFVFCSTCVKDENHNQIPDVSFSIAIPLQAYPSLQLIGNPTYFATFNGQALGYRNHGIYVVKVSSDGYRAFDASCSYDPEVTQHVLLKKNGYECPVCKSLFELFTGSVVKDPATYPLKEYQASLSAQDIRVYN